MQLVCFFLGDQEFGIPIDNVRETVELRSITPLFHTPPAVAGITNLRGDILAVLETAELVGLRPTPRDDETRILVVEAPDRTAGLLVDRLGPLRQTTEDAIGEVPGHVPAEIAAMLAGTLALPERPLGVIDVDRLLTSPILAAISAPREEPVKEAHG